MSAQPKETSVDRVNSLIQEWTRARIGAQEYIDAMPEDGIDFKPTPEIYSFAEHWFHVAEAGYVFASGVSGLDNPHAKSEGEKSAKMNEVTRSKASLLEFVMGSYDFMIEAVRTLDDARLDEPVKFIKWEYPRSMLLAKAMEHHAHHRGQTAIYLRLKGVKPPSERLF
jgi:uncharacterized damage-inducible protein DinB